MAEGEINDQLPRLGRVGVMGFVLGAIKEKNDARAVVALLGVVINAIPVVLGLLVPVAVGLMALLDEARDARLPEEPILMVLLGLGVGSALASAFVIIDHYRVRRRLGKRDLQNDFRILQCVSMCLVYSRSKIVYRHRYLVKARRNGLRHFPMGFTWSGEGKFDVTYKNPRYDHDIDRIAPGTRRLLKLDLGRNLSKGDEENIEFDFVTDTTGATDALPYYGITIPSSKFPALNTILIVSFAKGCNLASAHKETYFAAMSDRSLSRRAVEPQDGQIRWSLPTRVGWRYVVAWEWAKETIMEHD